METTVLDCFSKLASEEENVRFNAGVSLLRHLNQQISTINFNFSENEVPLSKELNYALTRIIRSLGASKYCLKKGNYITLNAFLTLHPEFPVQKILSIMDTELHPATNNPKSENADIYLGRILACGALIRSNAATRCSDELKHRIIDCLINAGSKRSYLSFMSTSFLVEFLNGVDTDSLSVSIWNLIQKEIKKPWKEQTLDTFYVLLFMEEKFPSLINQEFINHTLGTDKIIEKDSLNHILNILTNLPRIKSSQHPIFKLFCEKLILSELVNEFWTGIDERFKKPSKTDEYVATEMLKFLLLSITNKTTLPNLLSPNLLIHMLKRCFNHRKNHKDEIIDAFKEILILLISVVSDENIKPKTQIAILKNLILNSGDLMIERHTGIKILQRITDKLNAEGIKKLSKIYRNIIENTQQKLKNGKLECYTNAERTYAAQMLTRLLAHPSTISEREWRFQQLKFLFNHGLCDVSNISAELAIHLKECFYRALDHKLQKLSDLRNLLNELVQCINVELFSNNVKLRTPLSEEATETWQKVVKLIEKFEKDTPPIPIFHTMYLHMGLQLFSEPEMAIASINDLQSCYQRVTKDTKKKKKEVEEPAEEPKWVEVVVDLLLSLLSRNNHLLRSLVGCVFPHVCSYLTTAAVYQILEVLDVKSDKNPLSVQSDEQNEDSQNEDSESDESEDEVTGNGVNNVSEDSSEDSNSDSDNNLTEAEEDDTVNDRLRMAVQQALGDASFQTDDEDIDVDQIDEEEGKRLDESLAAAFRILKENRQSRTKKQEKSAQALTHFRIRVLDLLEAYLDSSPPMAIVFDILVALFTLLEYCIKDHHQKPLEHRVRACLKKLSGVKKFKNLEGVDEELLMNTLKIIIEKGERSVFVCQEMGDKLAECCCFLVRCLQHINLSNEKFINTFGENITHFFKKRDCTLPALLFKNLMQLCWIGNWQLASLLINFAFDSTIRSFRRSQALEFLIIFYKNTRLIKGAEDAKHLQLKLNMEKELCCNSVNVLNELLAAHNSGALRNNEASKEVKQKFVGLLLTLLHAVYSYQTPEAWNWQKVAEAIVEYRTNVPLSKNSKVAYNKLASQIKNRIELLKKNNPNLESKVNGQIQLKVKKPKENQEPESVSNCEESNESKRSDNEEIEVDKKSNSKKRKRHNMKDQGKSKKESRELRDKLMSNGLESVTFSSVVLNGDSDHKDEISDESKQNGEVVENSSPRKRSRTDDVKHRLKKKKLSHNE